MPDCSPRFWGAMLAGCVLIGWLLGALDAPALVCIPCGFLWGYVLRRWWP